jgi:shikimate dehydrogenase
VISSSILSSKTRLLAIIGNPIEHSISPRIQNAAWKAANIDIALVACRVENDNVEQAVRGAQSLRLLGLMVTVPHKERVLDVCDELDNSARDVGAANLLQFRDDGKIVGYSSDGWAAVKDLAEHGINVKNQSVAILGAGGAARSLALTLAHEGVRELRVLNRTRARGERLADEVRALGIDVFVGETNAADFDAHLRDVDLLINATSTGMSPHIEKTPLEKKFLRPEMAVYDIVYNPLETRLLREAREIGAPAIDGLGMLIGTNIRAAQICANADLSWTVMREEAMRALGLAR